MYILETNEHCFKGKLYISDKLVSHCAVDYDDDGWVISAWYTDGEYKQKGYGKEVLTRTLRELAKKKIPNKVEYVWNGKNDYVYNWLRNHFNATCNCPLAILKNESADSWDSHIYTLDSNKVIDYFELAKE